GVLPCQLRAAPPLGLRRVEGDPGQAGELVRGSPRPSGAPEGGTPLEAGREVRVDDPARGGRTTTARAGVVHVRDGRAVQPVLPGLPRPYRARECPDRAARVGRRGANRASERARWTRAPRAAGDVRKG